MAAPEHWPDSPLSSSNAHTPQSFTVHAVHLLQKLYLSLHRRCFPILSKDIPYRWTAGRGLLVFMITAVFLIILLSAHAQTPRGFTTDGALLEKVRTVDFSSLLCWEEIHQPFFLKTSLDLEIGLNIKGTLVYTVPAFGRRRSSSNDEDLVSGWTQEKERTLKNEDGHSAKTLDGVSNPPPYSHTEAQSIAESRVNQIVSPLSVTGSKALDVHRQSQPLLFHRGRVSRLKRSARRGFNQSQRLVRQLPELDSHREKADKDSSEKIKTGFGNIPSARQKVMSSEKKRKRNRRRGNRSISLNRNQKPTDLHHHQTSDNNNDNMFDDSPTSHSSAHNLKKLHNPSQTETKSSALPPGKGYPHLDQGLTKASRRLEVPGLEVRTHGWELLPEDAPGKMLMAVYSAFYDDRPTVRSASESVRRVRVLGLCLRHRLEQSPRLRREVFCHYRWSANPDLHVIQRGNIVSVADGLNSTYQAVFIICDLHLCASPDYVGITLDRKMLPWSYLPVQYPPPIGQRFRHSVTTCLPVMHSHFTDHLGLLQMLETDRLLGTEKFILYVHSASPEVAAIIRHYVTSGIMAAVEWRLPLVEKEEEEEEKEEMQSSVELLAAMNDCLYKAMYDSEHVVFHGFVESLLPRQHSTWTHMLWELQRQEKTSWWEWWRQTLGGTEYGSYTVGHETFSGSWTPLEQQKEEISKDTPYPYPTQSAPNQLLGVSLSVGQDKILDRKKEKSPRKREGIERQMGDPDRKNGDVEAENTKEENTNTQRTTGLDDKERTTRRPVRNTNDSTNIKKVPNAPDGHISKNRKPKRNYDSKQKIAVPGKTEHSDQLLHRVRYKKNSPILSKQDTLSRNYADRQENSDRLILGFNNPRKPEKTVQENGNDFPTITKDNTLLYSAERENRQERSETSFSILVKPHTVQIVGVRSVQQHVRGYQSGELPADMVGAYPYPVWRVAKGNARVRQGSGHHLAWLVRDRMRSVLKNVTRNL